MRSLQVKFSALLVAMLVVACVSLALVATEHERRALESEVEKRAAALASALAGAAKEPLLAIRQGAYKLIIVPSQNRVSLYDVLQDPGEQEDLMPEAHAISEPLFQQLGKWRGQMARTRQFFQPGGNLYSSIFSPVSGQCLWMISVGGVCVIIKSRLGAW